MPNKERFVPPWWRSLIMALVFIASVVAMVYAFYSILLIGLFTAKGGDGREPFKGPTFPRCLKGTWKGSWSLLPSRNKSKTKRAPSRIVF